MRIAIVTENFLPKVDGVTNTLKRLLEHLQETGHQVLLLGPESGMATFAGAELVGTAGIPFLPYPELKLNLWRPRFTRKLQEFDPHVIHLVEPVWLGAAALAICKLYLPHVPLVSSYHTNLATYCGHFGWGFLTPLMWEWNRFCHSWCRRTVCPSRSTSKMLDHKGFDNLSLWPRGIDAATFSPAKRSHALRARWLGSEVEATQKTVILYVGRVSFEKNIGLVLDAYKQLDYQNSCHLVIVGHGPAFDEIQSECARTNLPVTFTGYLRGIQLASAYASADVFAFPSVTETFGQVVLEAMASGIPVAGVQAEGVCDLVVDQQTGLLLDIAGLTRTQQIKGYAANLNRLVRCAEERIRMGHCAREAAKGYTWWEAMECMVRTYRDVALSGKYGTEVGGDCDSGVEEDFGG
ncbi:hypothetical protein DFQ28_008466 [Apophysomyces sp. BC1034]|nr:hypothetical protein DFQ30_011107 [Apophysomyces sp. BC1015]KAG0178509.1 hypothetical protein DFQ29_003384 [Apophysomyces sp. BC1021]KAG0185986.1 hypothetical protein DFQ28_008466 [Apophysomyces sp. BC1034]